MNPSSLPFRRLPRAATRAAKGRTFWEHASHSASRSDAPEWAGTPQACLRLAPPTTDRALASDTGASDTGASDTAAAVTSTCASATRPLSLETAAALRTARRVYRKSGMAPRLEPTYLFWIRLYLQTVPLHTIRNRGLPKIKAFLDACDRHDAISSSSWRRAVQALLFFSGRVLPELSLEDARPARPAAKASAAAHSTSTAPPCASSASVASVSATSETRSPQSNSRTLAPLDGAIPASLLHATLDARARMLARLF